MAIEKISQGSTFKGAVSFSGLIILICGIIILFTQSISDILSLNIALGCLLIFSGFVLFISIRGVIIDTEKNIIKSYFDIFLTKLGFWESLEEYDKIVLKYTTESQTMNSRGNSTNYQTRSFDIVLKSDYKKDLTLKEFVNYDEAKDFLIEYSKKMNKMNIDNYELIKQRIQNRKHQVRE